MGVLGFSLVYSPFRPAKPQNLFINLSTANLFLFYKRKVGKNAPFHASRPTSGGTPAKNDSPPNFKKESYREVLHDGER